MIGLVNRSRTALTALSMISALALGACSGDDPEPKLADPSPSASLPSSPSTTAVSGPVEPTMPAEARGTDAAAAEAFVKFYWEMADYAQATGDVDGLREISSEACEPCQAGIRAIESVFERDGRLLGGGNTVRILSTSTVGGGDRNAISVVADVTNRKQRLDLPGTVDDREFPASRVTSEFIVEVYRGSWLMSYWADKK